MQKIAATETRYMLLVTLVGVASFLALAMM